MNFNMKPHYWTEEECLADFARLMAESGAAMGPLEQKWMYRVEREPDTTDEAFEAARRALEARIRRTS